MKKVLKIILFILLFVLFFSLSEIYFKRRIPTVDYAYNMLPKNSIDILFIGSSHSYCSFNTDLFDSYLNVSTFNFGTDSQAIPGSYYAIKEILKKQDIKIVVLEVLSIATPKGTERNFYANTRKIVDDMKISKNKIEANLKNFPINKRVINFFNTTTYHERWKEIEKLNFNKSIPTHKGFLGNDFNFIAGTLNYNIYNESLNKKFNYNHPEENIIFLEKLCQYLNERSIKLILVSTPVIPSRDLLQAKYSIEENEKVKEIIEKYNNVEIINFNNDKELKLEKMHFSDDGHLSLAGSDLVSQKMARMLEEKYEETLKNIKRESDIKTIEYFLYNKNAKIVEENLFNEYKIDIEIEKDLIANKVLVYKKEGKYYDLFLRVVSNKNIYSYNDNEKKENEVILFGKKIEFKEKYIDDNYHKSKIFPKYYIREINGNFYIYLRDIELETNELNNIKNKEASK